MLTAGILRLLYRAQRLSASEVNAVFPKKDGSPRLTCAQRLSASEVNAVYADERPLASPGVLNAFRRQRLMRSAPLILVTSPNCLCSTPFGVRG